MLNLIFNKLIYKARLRAAVKEADEMKSITGAKQLVLLYKGRPVCLSKQKIKSLIKDGRLKATISELENIALYQTL